MNNILKLVKASYDFRKTANKCLKQNVESHEYKLAKHYDDNFKNLKDADLNLANVYSLIDQLSMQRIHYKDSDDIQKLISSTLTFLEVLTPFVKHYN